MFKLSLLLIVFSIFMVNSVSAQEQMPPLEAGVSQKLAQWRAAHYSNVRYKLNITLEKGAPLMRGEIEIRVDLTEEGAKSDLILDWRTTAFKNDKDKPYANVASVNQFDEVNFYDWNEHLAIRKEFLRKGENRILISFASPIKTSGAAITRYIDKEDGAEYVYSLFVPSDASTAFPVFDQPDLKARFKLTVNAPKRWKVVCNSRIWLPLDLLKQNIKSEPLKPNSKKEKTEDKTALSEEKKVNDKTLETWDFDATEPISTYVFAFAAGDFTLFLDNEDPSSQTMPVQPNQELVYSTEPTIYVRKSQAEKFKPHAKEVFRLNREAVKYLESYFDYKFPFPKYDLVLIPEFPFGGMEHAGATFLRESSIIFPSEPTANDFVSRANLIFHEAAHQWFGDTVTMKWFDDLWLKEGFAEFMAYKTLEKVMPEYNAWKAFYERNKPLAYLTDSTKGTTPIYQEIPNLSAAKSAYGNIVYRKAPSFLRQAEFYLGEKEFQTAVRAFLKKYEYKNAEWTDLVREFETASKQDLKDWANAWVKQRGMPIFKVRREEEFNSVKITIKPKDVLNEGGLWKMKTIGLQKSSFAGDKPFEISFDISKNEMNEVFFLSGVGHGDYKLDYFFPNYQDYGYGIFLLDEKSRDYVLKNIHNEKDDFLRSMMWGTLWDSVREAELDPKLYVELAIKNISVERDELTIQTILNRVSTAMNYYLPDAQRDKLTPQLENLLLEKMRNAPTLGQRITFYRAFLNTASSEQSRAVLKDVLNGKFEIKDLKLKTKDKFDILARLAVLGDREAPPMLADLQKTETSDDAKRYAYAVGAGFGTKEAKEKYFNDFIGNKEISESWIEAAFVSFNSTRHAELTLPFLEKALAELPNLKRNRKIFFVNGWLAAFIGGQKDEKALAIVNKFLADNPNLDKDLQRKILENVDIVERSVKIRAKFGK